MTETYDDIIELPRHVSAVRVPMPRENRAAQFLPFAALTGYDAAIGEATRLTDMRMELDESTIAALNRKLGILADRADEHPEIAVICFEADEKKEGGGYSTVTGTLKKIDEFERVVVFRNGGRVAFEDILEIESALLKDIV